MAKSKNLPQWDGSGNPFEWIIQTAASLRAGRPPAPALRLYIAGQMVPTPVPRHRIVPRSAVARVGPKI